MMRLLTSSCLFLALVGCGTGLKRPDALVCGVNGVSHTLRCYNARYDYGDDGVRKPDAVPQIFELEKIEDLQGWVCTDPKGLEQIKVSAADLRKYIKNRCQ